jgi:hypothetical protein
VAADLIWVEGGGEMGHCRSARVWDPVLLGGLVSSGKEENMGRWMEII